MFHVVASPLSLHNIFYQLILTFTVEGRNIFLFPGQPNAMRAMKLNRARATLWRRRRVTVWIWLSRGWIERERLALLNALFCRAPLFPSQWKARGWQGRRIRTRRARGWTKDEVTNRVGWSVTYDFTSGHIICINTNRPLLTVQKINWPPTQLSINQNLFIGKVLSMEYGRSRWTTIRKAQKWDSNRENLCYKKKKKKNSLYCKSFPKNSNHI